MVIVHNLQETMLSGYYKSRMDSFTISLHACADMVQILLAAVSNSMSQFMPVYCSAHRHVYPLLL